MKSNGTVKALGVASPPLERRLSMLLEQEDCPQVSPVTATTTPLFAEITSWLSPHSIRANKRRRLPRLDDEPEAGL